jgi:hypothetical protein
MRTCFREVRPVYFQQRYEALRREGLSPRTGLARGHGLALFLAQGMAAWMMALSTLLPPQAISGSQVSPSTSRRCPELAPSTGSDLKMILAGMVLACSQELPHE